MQNPIIKKKKKVVPVLDSLSSTPLRRLAEWL
jgi:hypothetical protein